jgi:hypothetical protein
MTFRSTKSLSSGYGSFRDSANVCCENGLSALTARICTFRASKRLKSAFLAVKFAAQVGTNAAA